MPVHYGLPNDAPTWGALLLAGVLLSRSASSWLLGIQRRWFVVGIAIAAFLLSTTYVTTYLRGGPRIIDATTYFLQARALAEGDLSWVVHDPSTATTGRFLVRDTLAGGDHMGGIFPPGYPAILAIGFALGSPMTVGPVLAALLAIATTWLADEALPVDLRAREAIIRVAALLSVVSSALRYHTADTMSHGLAALLLVTTLALAFKAKGRGGLLPFLALGSSVGLLFATRPVTGLAAVVMWLLISRPTWKAVPIITLGAAPALALFAMHQHAVTGAWATSSQQLYYAVSDGPAGCFDYGFGANIGCLGEHEAFVRHNLPDGYGFMAALKTTLRRLSLHVQDPLNDEVLGVALLAGVVVAFRRVREVRALALAPLVLVLAYVPFYFDGNYPGGGARFYAEALVVEIVVGTVGLSALAQTRLRLQRRPFMLVAASLIGFAINAHTDHELLRDREGGRPMWQPSDTRHIEGPALVFMNTDHGFALAHRPSAIASRGDVEVVRLRGDITDRLVFESRQVPAFRHQYDIETGLVIVSPFTPEHSDRLCGATLWPALEQHGGYAKVADAADDETCHGALAVTAAHEDASVSFELPAQLASHAVRPVVDANVPGTLTISDGSGLLAAWPMASEEPLVSARMPDSIAGRLRLTMRIDSPGLGTLSLLEVTAP